MGFETSLQRLFWLLCFIVCIKARLVFFIVCIKVTVKQYFDQVVCSCRHLTIFNHLLLYLIAGSLLRDGLQNSVLRRLRLRPLLEARPNRSGQGAAELR